jgi:hypothetical protein
VSERADAMRAAFDAGFAQAIAATDARAHTDLLTFEAAGQSFACAQAEVAALHVDLAIVPVPTQAPAFLGIAAIRNALVPIFDLRVLLGLATAAPPRWVIVAHGAVPIGLAFERFVGHVRWRDALPAGGLRVVRLGERAHDVLDLAAMAATLAQGERHG